MHASIASPAALAIFARLRLRAAPAPEPAPLGPAGYNWEEVAHIWDEYFAARAAGRGNMVAREAALLPLREDLRRRRRGRLSS